MEWQNGAAKGSSLGTRDNSGEAGLTASFGRAEQLGHSLKGQRPPTNNLPRGDDTFYGACSRINVMYSWDWLESSEAGDWGPREKPVAIVLVQDQGW